MDDLFSPPGGQWRPVSPSYVTVKRLSVLLTWGVLGVVVTVLLGVLWTWWAALVSGLVAVVFTAWRWSRMPAVVGAIGWCERGSDLCVRSGPWFRSMTIVPYGRMQSVEIDAGPIARHYGLANVQLVTASASTDATIPGLETREAAVIRDRITAMAEARDAAL
ncbi:PH domain-containing protein [Acidipropionibacterium timonense]|uniref:PH domain-containing protein n=1 Tax=Acidipropionibacterium timonense TaxID=2161818 RepID=UPI001031DB40|nr:PH domain-containing protein [Acidipropionibacterium timonense]